MSDDQVMHFGNCPKFTFEHKQYMDITVSYSVFCVHPAALFGDPNSLSV